MANAPVEEIVELPAAGAPVDRGASALGLLMQLGGGLNVAAAGMLALAALVDLSDGRGKPPWLLLVFLLSAVRSVFLRAAGAELVHGGRRRPDGTAGSPLAGARRYVAIAIAQTVAVTLILCRRELELPGPMIAGVAVALALWPAVIAALLARGTLAPLAAEIPYAEDKGFEGVSILMTVMGVGGAIATGAILAAYGRAVGGELLEGPGLVLAGSLTLLFIRSILHLQAGLAGLRETSAERAVALVNRYAGFSVSTGLCFGGLMMISMVALGAHVMGMGIAALWAWMLLMWPVAVRRFFRDRQFAELLAGSEAAPHRRAPDAGLTGLGWLLIGHAAYAGAFVLPPLLAGTSGGAQWLISAASGAHGGSPWWHVAVLALEAWAGYELVTMSPRHRLAALAYGILATAVTLYLMWPFLEQVLDTRVRGLRPGFFELAFAMVAIQVVLPITTLLLATRRIAPTAQARYRRRGAA